MEKKEGEYYWHDANFDLDPVHAERNLVCHFNITR